MTMSYFAVSLWLTLFIFFGFLFLLMGIANIFTSRLDKGYSDEQILQENGDCDEFCD